MGGKPYLFITSFFFVYKYIQLCIFVPYICSVGLFRVSKAYIQTFGHFTSDTLLCSAFSQSTSIQILLVQKNGPYYEPQSVDVIYTMSIYFPCILEQINFNPQNAMEYIFNHKGSSIFQQLRIRRRCFMSIYSLA